MCKSFFAYFAADTCLRLRARDNVHFSALLFSADAAFEVCVLFAVIQTAYGSRETVEGPAKKENRLLKHGPRNWVPWSNGSYLEALRIRTLAYFKRKLGR